MYSSIYHSFLKELIVVWTVEARKKGATFALNCVIHGTVRQL